jgi:hypothetical protein
MASRVASLALWLATSMLPAQNLPQILNVASVRTAALVLFGITNFVGQSPRLATSPQETALSVLGSVSRIGANWPS